MRAADSVVAVFLQQANAALLPLRIAARAEDALVVVDARALHNDALAVEQNALLPHESVRMPKVCKSSSLPKRTRQV